MSERVILDRVMVSAWIEQAFIEGSGQPGSSEVARRARAWWLEHQNEILKDLESHSLVLPYKDSHGD